MLYLVTNRPFGATVVSAFVAKSGSCNVRNELSQVFT